MTFMKTVIEEVNDVSTENSSYPSHIMKLRGEDEVMQFYTGFALLWATWVATSRDVVPQGLYGTWA